MTTFKDNYFDYRNASTDEKSDIDFIFDQLNHSSDSLDLITRIQQLSLDDQFGTQHDKLALEMYFDQQIKDFQPDNQNTIKVITVDDIANQILSIALPSKTKIDYPVSDAGIQTLTFLVIRDAMRQNLFDRATINQLVNDDKFHMSPFGPKNYGLQKRFQMAAGFPILETAPHDTSLSFLDDIISSEFKKHNFSDKHYEIAQDLRNEPFYIKNIDTLDHPLGSANYTEQAFLNLD